MYSLRNLFEICFFAVTITRLVKRENFLEIGGIHLMSISSYSLKLAQSPLRKFHLGLGIEEMIGTRKPMLRIIIGL